VDIQSDRTSDKPDQPSPTLATNFLQQPSVIWWRQVVRQGHFPVGDEHSNSVQIPNPVTGWYARGTRVLCR